nr:MAG TPA: hypothetical protein [Bacteriophage sp.]
MKEVIYVFTTLSWNELVIWFFHTVMCVKLD